MKKWMMGCLIGVLITVVLMAVIGSWLIHEAFGPSKRIVTIGLHNDQKLVCEETYNADLAAVFYDVVFTLQDNKHRSVHLGRATFSSEDWSKQIRLDSIGNWCILPVQEDGYAKLLINNVIHNIHADTTFSPLTLRDDSAWKATTDNIPDWVYGGSSRLDSINDNQVFITYEYRCTRDDSSRFFSQSIQYALDTANGSITTKKIFEAKRK